jgi:predicted dehydrogenase
MDYDIFRRDSSQDRPMIDAAIVGLGRWGKGIVEAAQGKSKRLRFVRGICKEPEQLADFAQAQGLELGTELSDAIADPQIKAIFLATPHSLHVDQICAVAAAGKPVWSEKPLALTRAEAGRAIAAVSAAKVPFGLGNNKRFFSSMRELKRIVADGVIGEVLHVEGHFSNEHSTRVKGGWRDDPRESPGGGMTGAGLHLVDAFVNLAGPIASADAKLFSRRPPPDPRDVVAALLQFESGASGLLATVRAAPMFWRIHVFGTKGAVESRDETTLTLSLIGKPFPVTTDDMLHVVGAFEAILRSIDEGTSVEVRNPSP